MQPDGEKKLKHTTWVIATGFIGAVTTFVISFFFPPDFSTDPPTFSPIMMMLGQLGTGQLILGCTALGIKLADEKKTLPAIGFTMMSIAQGVMFVLYLTAFTDEAIAEAYKTFSASLFLLIPSMVLIAFYSEFPVWLNILGVVACVPYIIENILFATTGKFNQTIMMVDGAGNILFNTTTLCWGILILKNAKREMLKLKNLEE